MKLNFSRIYLNFKMPFKKGVVGIENDIFFKDTVGKLFCSECGIRFKDKEEYYYWYPTDDEDELAFGDDEYLLCKKCGDMRK